MDKQTHSPKFLRKRKALLVLPVLIIPFITMAFWALGGGKGTGAQAGQSKITKGLNLQLPNASLKDDNGMDKMAYYQIAQSDSEKIEQLIKKDPNLQQHLEQKEKEEEDTSSNGGDNYPVILKKYVDPNEAKVYNKIEQLNKVLKAVTPSSQHRPMVEEEEPSLRQTSDQTKLKQLMDQMNNANNTDQDTEMKQLNGMLEKILDIQHPERLQERYEKQSPQRKEQVYAVSKDAAVANISLLDTNNDGLPVQTNQFFGLENKKTINDQNAIEAVVHETQTLVNGAVIKMRLLNDVHINGHLVHKDNFIYGVAMLNNERLTINIKSIRDDHSIYAVKMEVYDMDGLAGIYIPGAITRDVAKQSTDNAIQSLALNSLDPSLGAQAASAGIEMGKQLLSKKVKLVKVQVKAGYRILLKDLN